MKKLITKIGNSYVLSFTKQERKIYGLEQGTMVDLSDWVVSTKIIKPRRSIKRKTRSRT